MNIFQCQWSDTPKHTSNTDHDLSHRQLLWHALVSYCTVQLQTHKMQHCVVCTCELTFQKNQLLLPLSHSIGFNLNKDAACSFGTLVLM